MEKLKSEGKCLFCNKTFTKAGMSRHLKTHFKESSLVSPKGSSYLLKAETNPYYGSTPYFLFLWVDSNAKISDVDNFLREIWLECCGHMSSFTDTATKKINMGWGGFDGLDEAFNYLEQGKIAQYEKLMEESSGEIPKSRKVDKVFYQDQKLEYQYDFGSTTELLITIQEVLPIAAGKKIVLLSRNEPLEMLCDLCEKEPAEHHCIAHDWEEDSLFCPECAKKHSKKCPDFEDYADMPVVNSPRSGVCGYAGGIIDTERDGIFVRK